LALFYLLTGSATDGSFNGEPAFDDLVVLLDDSVPDASFASDFAFFSDGPADLTGVFFLTGESSHGSTGGPAGDSVGGSAWLAAAGSSVAGATGGSFSTPGSLGGSFTGSLSTGAPLFPASLYTSSPPGSAPPTELGLSPGQFK